VRGDVLVHLGRTHGARLVVKARFEAEDCSSSSHLLLPVIAAQSKSGDLRICASQEALTEAAGQRMELVLLPLVPFADQGGGVAGISLQTME